MQIYNIEYWSRDKWEKQIVSISWSCCKHGLVNHTTQTHTHNKKKKRNSAFNPLSVESFLIMCNTVTHNTVQYSTVTHSTVQ